MRSADQSNAGPSHTDAEFPAAREPHRRVYVTGDASGLMRVVCHICGDWLDFATEDEREAIEMVREHLAKVHPDVAHPGAFPHEQQLIDTQRSPELTEAERSTANRAYSEWRRHCYEAHPRVQITWEHYEQQVKDGTDDPDVRYEIVVRRAGQ